MSPRAYGDLTIYTVHPQPEIGGIRSLVLIVVVENPDDVHPDIRNIFVIPKARVSVAGDLTASFLPTQRARANGNDVL